MEFTWLPGSRVTMMFTCCIFAAFFGSSSELSPRVCQLILLRCPQLASQTTTTTTTTRSQFKRVSFVVLPRTRPKRATRLMLTAALVPPRGGGSDGSAHGGDMSGCPSQQHWRRPLTTAFRRVGGQKRKAPRGPKTASAQVEPASFQLFGEEDVGGARPDRLAGVRPQERVQRRTMEQIVDCVPVVPLLDVTVPQMVSGEVADVLGPCFVGTWEPLPQAWVLEPAAAVHQDLAQLERARRRTGREVADAYRAHFNTPRSLVGLSWDELRSLRRVIWPDDDLGGRGGPPPAQGGT